GQCRGRLDFRRRGRPRSLPASHPPRTSVGLDPEATAHDRHLAHRVPARHSPARRSTSSRRKPARLKVGNEFLPKLPRLPCGFPFCPLPFLPSRKFFRALLGRRGLRRPKNSKPACALELSLVY